MKKVSFTASEALLISQVAMMRRVQNVKRRIKARHGAPDGDGSWEIDIIGCMGEAALAKYLDRWWWGAVGDYRAKDLPPNWQVRACTKDWHQLIVHDWDDDDDKFVLAHVDLSRLEVTLVGWLDGATAKQPEFWSDPAGGRPAFFVPQDRLHDMDMA